MNEGESHGFKKLNYPKLDFEIEIFISLHLIFIPSPENFF